MALVSLYTFTDTITGTEQSMTTDTAGPDLDTNAGEFQATIDLNAMAAADIYQFAVYEKTISGGTQRLMYLAYFSDVQGTALWQSPPFTLSWGWDMTLKKLAGTNRSIVWTLWQHLPALSPTTAGNKLDVSAGGEAGVDWANIGSPTTAQVLSGTTIGTLTTYTGNTVQTGDVYPKVDTEIADIQARLPAALTANGNMKSSMVEILTTALTETAGQLAGGFKKFFNIAAPVSTMDVLARVTLTDTLTTYTGNTVQTGDSFVRIGATGSGLTTLATASALATVQSDTDDIQARLPAALTANGNMKSSMVEILTTALTETVGLLAGGFKKFFNISTPVSTMDVVARVTVADTLTTYTGNTPQTGDVYVLANTEIADIKAKTDLIPAAPAAVGDIPTATQNADALLKRDMSAVTGEAARSPLNALRFIRNKATESGGTLTVTKENDIDVAWTAAVTRTAGDPISGIDPA